MDLLKDKTDLDLLRSILAELAKSNNEISCARGDLNKAQNRQKFLLVLLNELINRQED
jgi:hypothetical protein